MTRLNRELCDPEAQLSEGGGIQSLPDILRTPIDDALLREQIRQINGNKVERVAILSFRALQLYRIAKLQAELVQKQNAIMASRNKPREDDTDSNVETGKELDIATEEGEVDGLLQRYGRPHGIYHDGTTKNDTWADNI